MKGKPRAVYLSPSLGHWLGVFPAEVLVLDPGPGLFDLPAALAERGMAPELIIQDERLAPRTLVKGLESFSCAKVFWSHDPHLNHYWQAPYAALFDAVATTQKATVEPLRKAGAGLVEWITWWESLGPWTPHAQRAHAAAFVGRVTEYRPMRRLFVEFLSKRFPIRVETDIPYDEVAGVYSQSRLAPNESIQGEITQRLFAAAAVGCAVLEPAWDNGLDELFVPGTEVITYRHGLELAEIMAYYSRHAEEAEKIGRAARERAGREHQPANRLEALGRLALAAPSRAPRGEEAGRLFWLAAARCMESCLLPGQPGEILSGLSRFRDDPECFTALLRLLVSIGLRPQALALAAKRAAEGFAPTDPGFQACVCALALRQGEFGLARRLFGSFAAASGEAPREADSPAALHAALADVLARGDMRWRPGFPFEPERHLPATAIEFYRLSLDLEPENQSVLRKAEALLRALPGSGLHRLGLLSDLSLRNRDDFRLGVSLGMANIEAFRVDEGLEELRLARTQASSLGKSASFERMLSARDPGGFIRAAL